MNLGWCSKYITKSLSALLKRAEDWASRVRLGVSQACTDCKWRRPFAGLPFHMHHFARSTLLVNQNFAGAGMCCWLNPRAT